MFPSWMENRNLTLTTREKKNPMGEVVVKTHLDLFGEAWLCGAVRPQNRKVCSKCFVSIFLLQVTIFFFFDAANTTVNGAEAVESKLWRDHFIGTHKWCDFSLKKRCKKGPSKENHLPLYRSHQ